MGKYTCLTGGECLRKEIRVEVRVGSQKRHSWLFVWVFRVDGMPLVVKIESFLTKETGDTNI